MNRIGILLATISAVLALLLASFGAMHASRTPAENTSPRTARAAAAAMKTVVASKFGAQSSTPGKGTGAGSAGNAAADAANNVDDDDDLSVIRFASNPSPLPLFMARELGGSMVSTAALKAKW